MIESTSFPNYTSHEFELIALNRFRSNIDFIPLECKIFREPWDSSTVVCFDFEKCPLFLEIVKGKSDLLLEFVERFALAKTIIFRIGSQIKGWRSLTYSNH